jgi:hypothetical protein
MIYEVCTYDLTPGSVPEVEKRFGEAYEYRKKYSEMTGFWHTDVGPLNEIIHIWPYKDLAELDKIKAAAAKDLKASPLITEFIRDMKAEILTPFPCSPVPAPGKYGPFYEMRMYTLKLGTLDAAMKVWEERLPARQELSPCHLVGHIDIGGVANGMYHIWSHHDMNERTEIRAKAYSTGIWILPGQIERIATQKNIIMLPAAFSPMQ